MASMQFEEFLPVRDMLVSSAPGDWVKLRVHYRYYDQTADLKAFVVRSQSSIWTQISPKGFELMDFFDAFRERHPLEQQKPWTTIDVTINRSGREIDVEFGYEIPNILDRSGT